MASPTSPVVTGSTDVDGVSLRSGNSLEYNLNFMEFSFPFSRYRWAVVTGAGMRWSRYRLDMNAHFQEVDGVTQLVPAPEGIVYNASKLNITSLTIPVLLEWQSPKHRRKAPRFFISGGVVGVVKTISSSKIVYHDADGEKRKKKMDRGMNLRPVTMDFLFQAGVGCLSGFLCQIFLLSACLRRTKARRCIQFLWDCSCIFNLVGHHSLG